MFKPKKFGGCVKGRGEAEKKGSIATRLGSGVPHRRIVGTVIYRHKIFMPNAVNVDRRKIGAKFS